MHDKVIFLVQRRTTEFEQVYSGQVQASIARLFDVDDVPIIQGPDIASLAEKLRRVEVIFSTWNMPQLTVGEIERCLPSVRHVFYAAGTVKYFAGPFLGRGVNVYSAASVNAKPVAEYAVSQILLGTKGFYRSRLTPMRHFRTARRFADSFPGNYGACVGLLGFGNIGRRVARSLGQHAELRVYCYDPYVTEAECAELGVEKANLEEIFATCDVISNHMPDIDETKGVISSDLLSQMKPTAVFINTGRGAQVDERALARTLRKNPLQTALLDVTHPEPMRPWNPLLRCGNAIVTPHIAGSLGNEKLRMGEAMLAECERVLSGEPALFRVDEAAWKRGA